MHRVFKSDASPEFVSKVQAIENQSDLWFSDLEIGAFPHDWAVWGILTQVVSLIEDSVKTFGFGSQQHRETMINLGRCTPLLLETLHKQSLPKRPFLLRWTAELSSASLKAVLAAANFESFVTCFTLWHKNRTAAEILSPTCVRFASMDSTMGRRVRAHQQGVRIAGWPSTVDQPIDKALVDDPTVKDLLSKLWTRVTLTGALAMEYPEDEELLSVLRDIYAKRLGLVFRRDPSLDVGGYTLQTFRDFYAALMAFCSVHEHFCFAWGENRGRYPFESAVVTKSSREWADLIARVSGLPTSVVSNIINDLTLGTIQPLDVYVHPFIPSQDRETLFLIPHFVLNSRAEENLLRVCSLARPRVYSNIQNAKEEEMRSTIKENAPDQFTILGPLALSDPRLPDIDLLIQDSNSSSVLIGELKWARKTMRVREHLDRDAELERGFQQLRELRTFLCDHPQFIRNQLQSREGDPDSGLSYCLIARDHMAWIEPEPDIWLTARGASLDS